MSKSSNVRKNVLILSMGGTLGMQASSVGALRPDKVLQDLLEWVPELKSFANIQVEILENIDSSLMVPDHWLKLARRIEQAHLQNECDGIVVLHGTDTLAFTASALSFLLLNITMPIVLTGAQRPLAVTRTDARNNILGAVESALQGPIEVMVFFHHRAYRGNRVTKAAIADFDGFQSPNYPELGRAGIDWVWNRKMFWPTSRRPSIVRDLPMELPPPPLVLPWVPGMKLQTLAEGLHHQWALIIEAFGTGNLPLTEEVISVLKEFMDRGGLVFIKSQVMRGSAALGSYEPGKMADDLGLVDGVDMTREAMVTKLMVLKGYGLAPRQIQYKLSQSLVGELTEHEDDSRH